MSATVALVLVSHSAEVARGTAEIAGQMAPDVLLLPAGGMAEGMADGIGTSVDLVLAAVERGLAECAGGVVVLTDLGSAVLTTEVVLEMVDAERVRLPDAPIVEGAVAAAVAAQQGGDLAAVAAAALAAGAQYAPAAAVPARSVAPEDQVSARVTLRNPLGLHARTAAQVARVAADSGLPMTIDGVDAASVLALMSLGAAGGHELVVAAAGDGAQAAVDAVVALVASGFGEV